MINVFFRAVIFGLGVELGREIYRGIKKLKNSINTRSDEPVEQSPNRDSRSVPDDENDKVSQDSTQQSSAPQEQQDTDKKRQGSSQNDSEDSDAVEPEKKIEEKNQKSDD